MRNIALIEKPPDDSRCFQQELVGAKSGIDSCRIVHVSLPAGAESESANECEERLIYLRSGLIEVQCGREEIQLRAGGYSFLPRGKSHSLRNFGSAPALLIDIRAWVDDATPSPIAARPLSAFIGDLSGRGFCTHEGHRADGRPFDTKILIDREKGAERLKVFAAVVRPGSGMGLHIHTFDQFYLMLEGAMDIQLGLAKATVSGGAVIAFPAGIVHANRNSTSDLIRQITINVQERTSETFEVALSEMKR